MENIDLKDFHVRQIYVFYSLPLLNQLFLNRYNSSPLALHKWNCNLFHPLIWNLKSNSFLVNGKDTNKDKSQMNNTSYLRLNATLTFQNQKKNRIFITEYLNWVSLKNQMFVSSHKKLPITSGYWLFLYWEMDFFKSHVRFFIERNEILKKQPDFKSVHFECRIVLLYTIWGKSRLFFHRG